MKTTGATGHPQAGIFISSALIALLLDPTPIKMVENLIERDMFRYETESYDRLEMPKLEYKTIKPVPVHPLNVDPQRLLGDRFVLQVDKIEKRATRINMIF